MVRILEPVSSIQYDFVQGGSRIEKTVHYFLMAPVGGDLSRHDNEFERVRWVPFDEAGGLLTFPTERELVASTFARVRDLAAAGMFEPTAAAAGAAGVAAAPGAAGAPGAADAPGAAGLAG